MATPKYRFIPLPYMQEVAARLASETPTLIRGSLYTYRLPLLSEKIRPIISREVTNDLKNWAKAEQKVVTPTTKSRFLRLKAPDSLWTDEGYTSLLVPLFDRTIQVSVRARGSDEEALIDWGCESILHLDERMGIRTLTEDIDFHLNIFQLTVTPGTMAEEEYDGDTGV
ncbi:hypothetical protein C7999DRAFT_36414 [Corynascus novoguineensis]|uniref:Uncharacterized protein n=1 Tax=Corynascus novoguineensis TaxID=1126955 RepID=A0AAN7HKC1_9PEZI|nr:hypothetical protein C7999DRAFT_36414 [Corynascus novoguineensis]